MNFEITLNERFIRKIPPLRLDLSSSPLLERSSCGVGEKQTAHKHPRDIQISWLHRVISLKRILKDETQPSADHRAAKFRLNGNNSGFLRMISFGVKRKQAIAEGNLIFYRVRQSENYCAGPSACTQSGIVADSGPSSLSNQSDSRTHEPLN